MYTIHKNTTDNNVYTMKLLLVIHFYKIIFNVINLVSKTTNILLQNYNYINHISCCLAIDHVQAVYIDHVVLMMDTGVNFSDKTEDLQQSHQVKQRIQRPPKSAPCSSVISDIDVSDDLQNDIYNKVRLNRL